VVESTLNSLPALKPYQPNHKRPVPSATSGMECGPRSAHLPLADVEHRCEAACRRCVHHDAAGEVEHAPLLEDPAAPDHVYEGEYTNSSQPVRKSMYALNLTRLANAPVMSAGVMMANIIW